MTHYLLQPMSYFWRRATLGAGFAVGAALSSAASGQVASPLTLSAVLDSVRASHPTVQAADSRIRVAEGSRTTARAFGNPVLSYQVDQTPFPGGSPLPNMEREAMTTATFPLEGLYQRGPRVARANAQVQAAQADAAATRQRLGLDAAAAYYRVAIAQVQVATTRDLVDWLDTLVTYNRFRVQEGVAAEADLIRSELERDRMASEAAMQNAELALARAALGALVFGPRTSGVVARVAVDEMPLPLLDASRSEHSIDARPDVRAARERMTASAAGIAAERGMLFRQVAATIGTMQTGRTTSMIAGISLPVPLFDANRGEIQRANAEHGAATFELSAAERAATADLQGARDAAMILTERTTALTRRDSTTVLARADELRRIALGAYREGAVPLFQVIDAARSWGDARMTYYRTVFAQHQSILTLIVAEGLDLFTAAPAPIARGGARR